MPLDVGKIIGCIRQVVGEDPKLQLHEPFVTGNEWLYVKECLDTGWVSSAGKFVDRFEAQLAEFTGVRRAVAVVNGTAALDICLRLSEIEQGDEVVIPTLTFVATANAVMYCGAIPHFADSEATTLGLDPQKLGLHLEEISEMRSDGCYNRLTGRRIKAVVPMHTFGHPVDLDPLAEVCVKYRLVMIEDAAESLGTFYKGRHTGSWGRLSALSFNGNKIVTTGGGGAILTNDDELGTLAKHLTTTAKVPHRWEISHDMVGYNYRLPNVNAAIGCAQMEELPLFLTRKRALAAQYRDVFEGQEGFSFFSEPGFARSNYWLNVLLLDEELAEERDVLLAATNDNGILTRPAWNLMHRLPMFAACPHMDLTVAESLERRLINIPSSAFLGVHNDSA